MILKKEKGWKVKMQLTDKEMHKEKDLLQMKKMVSEHMKLLKIFLTRYEGRKTHKLRVDLSRREIECLYWASKDKTMAQTAEILYLSIETIKSYRKNALSKLRCRTIAGAVMQADSQHLFDAIQYGD